MTQKNDTPWVFHQRFFEGFDDFLEMFETCFDSDAESVLSAIEEFDYSGRNEDTLLGSFYDEIKDQPALVYFTFGRFETLNGHPKKGLTAQANILGQEVLLYGWSDEHDMYTFFPCDAIEGSEVKAALFGE